MKELKYMILNENHKLIPVDLMTWAGWIETNKTNSLRIVKQENIGDYYISTVFLGLDHSFGFGKPLWFETMVFNAKDKNWHDYQERYTNWKSAELGHNKIVAKIKKLKK